MYYLYVWSGCSHEIFSIVSLSIYTLCICFYGISHAMHVLNLMNECLQKLIPTTQLFLNFIKRKTSKRSFGLYKEKYYYGKYLAPYQYNPGQIQYKVDMCLILSNRVCRWTYIRTYTEATIPEDEFFKKEYYGELFYIRILHFTSRFLQVNTFTCFYQKL